MRNSHSIDSTVNFLELARSAARSLSPNADQDIAFFIAQAEESAPLDDNTKKEIWELFKETNEKRLVRIDAAIARYKDNPTKPGASEQLEWYVQQKERLLRK